ncbi:acyl-CoA thioesterase [Singulisphaera rosea]
MHPEPDDSLDSFPIIVTLPVQWGDQDAFGHVNNTIYLRWCESSRIAYFGSVGLSARMGPEQIGPILASITCHYRRQVNYPETVKIGARVARIGRSSVTLEHKIFAESSGMLVAEAHATIVVFDYIQNRSHPVPDTVRRAIEVLEGKPFPA